MGSYSNGLQNARLTCGNSLENTNLYVYGAGPTSFSLLMPKGLLIYHIIYLKQLGNKAIIEY